MVLAGTRSAIRSAVTSRSCHESLPHQTLRLRQVRPATLPLCPLVRRHAATNRGDVHAGCVCLCCTVLAVASLRSSDADRCREASSHGAFLSCATVAVHVSRELGPGRGGG